MESVSIRLASADLTPEQRRDAVEGVEKILARLVGEEGPVRFPRAGTHVPPIGEWLRPVFSDLPQTEEEPAGWGVRLSLNRTAVTRWLAPIAAEEQRLGLAEEHKGVLDHAAAWVARCAHVPTEELDAGVRERVIQEWATGLCTHLLTTLSDRLSDAVKHGAVPVLYPRRSSRFGLFG